MENINIIIKLPQAKQLHFSLLNELIELFIWFVDNVQLISFWTKNKLGHSTKCNGLSGIQMLLPKCQWRQLLMCTNNTGWRPRRRNIEIHKIQRPRHFVFQTRIRILYAETIYKKKSKNLLLEIYIKNKTSGSCFCFLNIHYIMSKCILKMANSIVNLVCKLLCDLFWISNKNLTPPTAQQSYMLQIIPILICIKSDPTKLIFYHKCCNMIALFELKESWY
jgi:hypothetical protein